VECKQLANNVPAEEEIRLKRGVPVMCLVNLDVDAGIANGSLGVVVDFVVSATGTISSGKGVPSVEMCPVVRFYNGVVRPMEPYVWQSGEIPTICVRQMPLALAYANSIHKMQGASLDVCEMDLGASIFAEHQTYVALSRVRSLEGVYLSAFHPHRIRVNPKVEAFYARFVDLELGEEGSKSDDRRSVDLENDAGSVRKECRSSNTLLKEDADADADAYDLEAAQIASASGECPICMDRMEKPHQTACKHVFCYDCLMRHMQCTLHVPCCPMCRADISIRTIQPVSKVKPEAKAKPVSSNKKTVSLTGGGIRKGQCLLVHKEE
jgi:hypothetical protein